jgi:hypothetical protein
VKKADGVGFGPKLTACFGVRPHPARRGEKNHAPMKNQGCGFSFFLFSGRGKVAALFLIKTTDRDLSLQLLLGNIYSADLFIQFERKRCGSINYFQKSGNTVKRFLCRYFDIDVSNSTLFSCELCALCG